ncbi:hypothetical protein KCU62_g435, partial [Aureobasidium sp. EXF-3399]
LRRAFVLPNVPAHIADKTPTTNPTDPLDTNPLTYFHRSIFSARTHGNDFAYALVTTDLAWLGGMRECFPGMTALYFLGISGEDIFEDVAEIFDCEIVGLGIQGA